MDCWSERIVMCLRNDLVQAVLAGVILLAAILCPGHAFAEDSLADAFQYSVMKPGVAKLNQLSTDRNRDPVCQSTYSRIMQQRRMVIHIGFGYFDQSRGYPYIYENRNYGLNAALDSVAHEALLGILTAPCTGASQLCGFLVNPNYPVRDPRQAQELYKGPDSNIPFQVSENLIYSSKFEISFFHSMMKIIIHLKNGIHFL